MPKTLSLKKAHQNAPPKNQKAITQFFKNTNSAQTSQKSLNKTKLSQEKDFGSKSNKRKAISPVQVATIEILDDPCVSNETTISTAHGYCTPKKIKNDSSCKQKSPKNACLSDNKIPQKENDIRINQSPLRNCVDLKELSQVKNDKKCIIDHVSLQQNHDRSPLTPVDNCNFVEKCVLNDRVICNGGEKTKSSLEHHIIITEDSETPKEVIQFENHENINILSPGKRNITPKKSSVPEVHRSAKIAKLKTPDKLLDELSPSKSGSTVKTLDFSQNGVDDVFGDEWDIRDVDEEFKEDLDLSIIQRCEVASVTRHSTRLELRLKNSNNNSATCFVEGVWLDTPVTCGDIVSIIATRDASGQFSVGNTTGLLILRPDHLMSSTSVVAGVFCKRKAVLQERWRGIDSANIAMTIGILIHELVQKALTQKIMDIVQLRIETEKIIKESVQMLYDAGLSEEEARSNMQTYIPPLAEFMEKYVCQSPIGSTKTHKDQWRGHIDKVLDIEENLCCPQLGLKGKIDATLQVTIHERKERQRTMMPLELKSGKASVSAEHRGQLVLYGMMLSLLKNEDPTRSIQRGLLLYLRERIDLREVSCGYPERRDLIMLRNQLVQYLASGPQDVDPDQLTDIEDASCLLQQKLPEPVHHETACVKCPYLTICSLHLWHTNGPSVSGTHPLAKLREDALGHLSPEHIQYFLHWTALLKIEEKGQQMFSPLHSLWTDSAEKRAKKGTCAANLKLKTVQQSNERYLHVFERLFKEIETLNEERSKGPQEGDFSTVSLEHRPWIAAGVVTASNEKEIAILLERDLSRRLAKDTLFYIDTYESYATTVQNLTNLGVLLEDSDRSLRLRRLIIDKDPPQFEKLPREVGRLGTKLMRTLNIEQQRAVLKAIAAKDYALLQGLPGTGKTQTISVLIQMLVGLKQRVLVTAHTHSAVDTVLSRLPEPLHVMRLGTQSRVAACVQPRCEQTLAAGCDTPAQLELLYNSVEVVGVTCLGATHAMLARTTFDVCIVDEATQVLQCTVLRPLFAAKRFVLVGDPEQLPPVVRSRAARRLGMEDSLFHRLMSADATSTLQLQYRMNKALADIANRVAYSARLKCADEKVATATLDIDLKKLCGNSTAQWLLTVCSPQPEHAAIFLDMDSTDVKAGSNKTCSNVEEACIVLVLIDNLIKGGVKPSEIGVIAPFRDQVSLLRRPVASRGAEASTVDQFQGRDKSVILYSCTKREVHDDRKVTDGEILNDPRRLAVSVTRAKHKLLIVGNSRALQRYAPLQRLIDACTPLNISKGIVTDFVNKYKTEFL